MSDRLQKITDLLKQKAAIDTELAQLKGQLKAEKAAFNATRKPRKPKEAELPLKPVPTPAAATAAPVKK
jgi:hypothetical protein